MGTIAKFEDIIAWQKAIDLTNLLYSVTEKQPFSRDFTLKDQMKKSVLSISSNIAEGFERESNNSFIYFLRIAKGSAGEFRSQLYVAKNRNYINEEEFNTLYAQSEDVSKLISGFISYLRKVQVKKIIKFTKSIFTFYLL